MDASLAVGVLGLVAVTGLLMIVGGIAGRRVGRTPHCRACGYNLTGTPSGRCPECGQALSEPEAVVQGSLRRERVTLVLGLLALGIGGGGLGMIAFEELGDVNWRRYHPTVWLVSELAHSDPQRVDAANEELVSRHRRGVLPPVPVLRAAIEALRPADQPLAPEAEPLLELVERLVIDQRLTAEERTRLADALLERHAQGTGSVLIRTILGWRERAGRLSEAQRGAFFEGLVGDLVIRTRDVWGVEQPQGVLLTGDYLGFERESGLAYWFAFDALTVAAPPHLAPQPLGAEFGRLLNTDDGLRIRVGVRPKITLVTAVVATELTLSARLRAFRAGVRGGGHPSEDGPPLHTWEVAARCPVTLQRDATDAIMFVQPPELREGVLSGVRLVRDFTRVRYWMQRPRYAINVDSLPIALAFDVCQVVDGEVNPIGQLSYSPRPRNSSMPTTTTFGDYGWEWADAADPEPVILLCPSQAVTRWMPDDTFWGGALRFDAGKPYANPYATQAQFGPPYPQDEPYGTRALIPPGPAFPSGINYPSDVIAAEAADGLCADSD